MRMEKIGSIYSVHAKINPAVFKTASISHSSLNKDLRELLS